MRNVVLSKCRQCTDIWLLGSDLVTPPKRGSTIGTAGSGKEDNNFLPKGNMKILHETDQAAVAAATTANDSLDFR